MLYEVITTPMEELPYDAEKALQELLAEHPDLLAGDQIDSNEPRRWLLVSREMPVPGKAMVGIEVPNGSTSVVALRGIMESSES